MDQDLELKRIEERLEQVPEELEDLLYSEETAEQLDAIAQKHQIPEAQWNILLEEVARVALGLTSLSSLKDRLVMRLQLPQGRMLALAADIDREVLTPVHHLLVQSNPPPSPQSSTPPTPTLQTNNSLADQVAQFQARKKQREEELKKAAPVQTQPSQMPTTPAQPPPNLPQ